MNLPNKITLIRLILVPIILVLMLLVPVNENLYNVFSKTIDIGNYHLPILWIFAGVLFIIASLTDFLDGYLARKYNLVTTFGKFFDPIADKFLVNGVVIVMSVANIIPVWITIIIILRDVFVDAIRMFISSKAIVISANKWGKLKTIWQMIGLTLLFFANHQFFTTIGPYHWINQLFMIPMYIAVFFSLLSGIIYFIQSKKYLLESK